MSLMDDWLMGHWKWNCLFKGHDWVATNYGWRNAGSNSPIRAQVARCARCSAIDWVDFIRKRNGRVRKTGGSNE